LTFSDFGDIFVYMQELLSLLQGQVEHLRCNPQEIDIDHLVSLVSNAHELARDGLERSQSAARVPVLEEELSELQQQVKNLQEKVRTLTSERDEIQGKYAPLAEVEQYYREEATARLRLVSHDGKFREELGAEIREATPARLVEIHKRITADFQAQWDLPLKGKLEGGGELINISQYRTGGKHAFQSN
jgi:chromosome condensin MukBEF ATPase and DNA-binding subunit MukB